MHFRIAIGFRREARLGEQMFLNFCIACWRFCSQLEKDSHPERGTRHPCLSQTTKRLE
jgi:hypothetical protein